MKEKTHKECAKIHALKRAKERGLNVYSALDLHRLKDMIKKNECYNLGRTTEQLTANDLNRFKIVLNYDGNSLYLIYDAAIQMVCTIMPITYLSDKDREKLVRMMCQK